MGNDSVQSWLETKIEHVDTAKVIETHRYTSIRLPIAMYRKLHNLAERARVPVTDVMLRMLESSLAALSQDDQMAKILNDE